MHALILWCTAAYSRTLSLPTSNRGLPGLFLLLAEPEVWAVIERHALNNRKRKLNKGQKPTGAAIARSLLRQVVSADRGYSAELLEYFVSKSPKF